MKFMVGEQVFLKVQPMKGAMRFENQGKLSMQFILSFEILM